MGVACMYVQYYLMCCLVYILLLVCVIICHNTYVSYSYTLYTVIHVYIITLHILYLCYILIYTHAIHVLYTQRALPPRQHPRHPSRFTLSIHLRASVHKKGTDPTAVRGVGEKFGKWHSFEVCVYGAYCMIYCICRVYILYLKYMCIL